MLFRPAALLGMNLGETHIIRNGGGSAKEALRNIIISQRQLGTREIAVFHHTDCGMLTFTNEQLHDKVKAEAPGNAAVAAAVDAIDFLPFSYVEESGKEEVKFLKESPLVLEGTVLTGWVHDLTTGKRCQDPQPPPWAPQKKRLTDQSTASIDLLATANGNAYSREKRKYPKEKREYPKETHLENPDDPDYTRMVVDRPLICSSKSWFPTSKRLPFEACGYESKTRLQSKPVISRQVPGIYHVAVRAPYKLLGSF
ncbi:unnamed protein product [Cyclocybe aegerita]|uniref:Carbonic anhydrase n=1 Tax=Cyclocybe aegerita TaxID=1973307 RepID=A0A8S0W606_CYCAE|nr:unnamed protein product [Cyclocybe aegerita]